MAWFHLHKETVMDSYSAEIIARGRRQDLAGEAAAFRTASRSRVSKPRAARRQPAAWPRVVRPERPLIPRIPLA